MYRNNPATQRIRRNELHAHLNGSISLETLKELQSYNEKNGDCLIDKETWINWEKKFLQPEISTLAECFQIFQFAHCVTITPDAVQMATEKVIEEFANDNVIYLELRSTLREESKMTKVQYIESMIAAVKKCCYNIPRIIVKLIVSINRKLSIQEAKENIDLAITYSKLEPDLVVGIDLSGDPCEKTFNDYSEILTKARESGLRLTIHFAEIPGNEEINNILKFEPDRLGHGTCVHEMCGGSLENWNLLLSKKIPVEVCVTSNIKCKTVPSIEKHHFQLLYNAHHPLSISTDDKSVFQTNLSTEYEIIKKAFNISDEELWQLNYNSINFIFADEAVKSKLRNILISWKKFTDHNFFFTEAVRMN